MGTVGGKARHEFLLGQAPPHVIDRFAEGADMIVLDTMHILPVELRDYLAILLALNRYGVKYPNIGAMQVTEEIFSHVGGVFHALMLNITVTEYRQSGEMETAVPVFRKPAFRKNGNHYGC